MLILYFVFVFEMVEIFSTIHINNVIARMWGAALAVMPRVLPAVYPDGTGDWIKADM